MKPDEAILVVTSKCNSKCIMCDVWNISRGEELKPGDYERLPPSVSTVRVTGGEPFLREDLPAVIEVVNRVCRRPRFVIATNGLLPDVIERQIKAITRITWNVGVRVSIDAVGRLDDEIRGVEGAYDKALESLGVLKELGVRDLGIAFTIQDANVNELGRVYDLSRRLGVEFSCCLVDNSIFRYGRDDNTFTRLKELGEQIDYVVCRELQTWSPKRWFRAYYFRGLLDYAGYKCDSSKSRRDLKCTAVEKFFLINPGGDVYPCTLRGDVLGNIKEKTVEAILDSSRAIELSRKVKDCPINCWTMCNVTTTLKRYWLSSLKWILYNKLKAHACVKDFVSLER